MQKLLGYAEPGDTVVVWRVDRLGRSLIDVLNTVNLLRERGIQVRSVSDGIDPATSTGRLMLNMLATLAEQNWEPVLKPWPLRPPVEGGFTLDDFTHDPAAATLTCPAGITRPGSSKGTGTRVTKGRVFVCKARKSIENAARIVDSTSICGAVR